MGSFTTADEAETVTAHEIININDDVKEYHETKRYGEKVAFRNKEACQKYCDWLNEKQKEQ